MECFVVADVQLWILLVEHPHVGVGNGMVRHADGRVLNKQYPKLDIRYNETFHDRFFIIDDKELYLVGASLKDLGAKCFAFTKLDSGEIPRIKRSAFNPAGAANR